MKDDTKTCTLTAKFPFDVPATQMTTGRLAVSKCVCPSCMGALMVSLASDISKTIEAEGFEASAETTPIGVLLNAAAMTWLHLNFTKQEFDGVSPEKMFTVHAQKAMRDAKIIMGQKGQAGAKSHAVH